MSDGGGPDGCELAVAQIVERYARQNALRKEFTDAQLATLDALWRAKRDGQVSDEAAEQIEELVRAGQVRAARRRLTVVRRDRAAAPDP